jgi:3-methylcrotonyl-CoA carboxylase alpha subunit
MSETLKISGKKFKLPSANAVEFELRPGGWVVATIDGKRTRFAVSEARGKFGISLHGKLYQGEVATERKHGSTEAHGGDTELVAQFPGKVRKILVAEGSRVQVGEPMILVEAMKMEFTVKAPSSGKVSRVLVAEGQQLSPGDRFFDFEIEEGGAGE